MQDNETLNEAPITESKSIPKTGRLISMDPGTKKAGLAVSDPDQKVVRRLKTIPASNWKKLLSEITLTIADLDAVGLIVGLPLNTDGSESEMSSRARRFARNFKLSLDIPVFLQDERVSTWEARKNLWSTGKDLQETAKLADEEAAAIILEDFLSSRD